MKASIVEMEGLLRGKCVTAKMLVNESLAEYLVRQFDALHEQVRALAAEAESLREQSEEVYAAGYNHGHLNTADGIAYAPGTKDDFYPNALQVMAEVETPATDAALREIRAQAVEEYAITVGAEKNGAIYAASIRAGEQP